MAVIEMEMRKMSDAINKKSVTVVKAKGFVSLSMVILLVLMSLAAPGKVQATVPVPSGFQLIFSDTGVKVYRKNYTGGQPDYVTVVDLRYGTIRNFTGWVYGESIERRSLATHWNNAVAQNSSSRRAKVAVNGTFFSEGNDPTPIAFGLKADWWRMSYGYGLNEYPGLIRTLAFDSSFGSSSIQPYSTATFDGGIPDVVGGLDPSANKSAGSYIGRTFVGVRDDNGDGHSETVIFFSSSYATQAGAVSVLNGFGAGSKMMLDGGGSTGLIVDGTSYINPARTIPHAIIICAGRQ
jgi:hypothetical protein